MSKGYAIITGAARGLGAATLLQLAKEGYDVVGTYVHESSEAKIQKVIDQAKEFGVKAMYCRCEVSKYEDCQKLMEFAVSELGKNLSVLVNNAGIAGAGFFAEEPRESYENMINTNLVGQLHCTHFALPYMLENKKGHIVFLSSIGGTMGVPTQAVYGAAKAGLIGFTKALSKEVASFNVMVNCVAPGVIDTDMVAGAPPEQRAQTNAMIPVGRMGTAQDIADCVSYIVNSNYLTGQTISPNGGIYA